MSQKCMAKKNSIFRVMLAVSGRMDSMVYLGAVFVYNKVIIIYQFLAKLSILLSESLFTSYSEVQIFNL